MADGGSTGGDSGSFDWSQMASMASSMNSGSGGDGGGGLKVSAKAFKKAEKIRNEAFRDASGWRRTTAFLMALVNAYMLIQNFKKQKKLADRSYKMSIELHNRLMHKFFPKELKFLSEFGYDGGEDIESIEAYSKRYGGRLRATIAKTYTDKLKKLTCQAPRYCVSQVRNVYQDLHQQKAFALAQANIAGNVIGFNEYQQRISKARNRRLQAIGLGRDLVGTSMSAAQTAQKYLDGAGAQFASNLKTELGRFVNADQARFRYDDADFIARMGGTWNAYYDYQDYKYGVRGQTYAPNPSGLSPTARLSQNKIHYSYGLTEDAWKYDSNRKDSVLNYYMTQGLDKQNDWNVINRNVDGTDYGQTYHSPAFTQTNRSSLYSLQTPGFSMGEWTTNSNNYPNGKSSDNSSGGMSGMMSGSSGSFDMSSIGNLF